MAGQGKEFWLPHLAAMTSQAKPLTVYAREQNLSAHALGWWRRKLKTSATATRASEPTASASGKPAFVSLKLSEATAAASAPVMLSLGDELRLQLSTLPNVQWLAALGKALREQR